MAPAHPGGPRKRAVKRLWCGVVGSGSAVFLGKVTVGLSSHGPSSTDSVVYPLIGTVA